MQTEAVQPSFFSMPCQQNEILTAQHLLVKWIPLFSFKCSHHPSFPVTCWYDIFYVQYLVMPDLVAISPSHLDESNGIHSTGKCCAVRILFCWQSIEKLCSCFTVQLVWGCFVSSEFGQIWALEVLYNKLLRLIWSLSHATHISAVHLQLDAGLESVHEYAVDM